jgi:hypothetical protein
MSTRHLFAAAALLAATFSAQADVIPTTPDALASSTVTVAATDSAAQTYLVRGVEGLYMRASRLITEPGAADAGTPGDTVITAPVLDAGTPAPAPVAIDLPAADAGPLAEVPEPSSIALMLAGLIGAAGFTRARKQR